MIKNTAYIFFSEKKVCLKKNLIKKKASKTFYYVTKVTTNFVSSKLLWLLLKWPKEEGCTFKSKSIKT